jgi:hypothetical protein
MNLSKLPTLPASKLKAELAKSLNEWSKLVDEMILAGRGHEKPDMTLTKADSDNPDELSVRFAGCIRHRLALCAERDARLKYSGTLAPMP